MFGKGKHGGERAAGESDQEVHEALQELPVYGCEVSGHRGVKRATVVNRYDGSVVEEVSECMYCGKMM
jgi:hypothetical protein